MINSLGIKKSPKDTKIVVAMSGGVDSSVVAGLMKKEGYNVTGITLKLYDDIKSSNKGRQCCAGQDIVDAKRVSETLGIEHKILYYQKKFKTEVIDSFIDSYTAGETPIPCVQCNQTVKFRDLFKFAKKLNADALVTGHYVLRHEYNGGGTMYRAEDKNRDQSYFLFSTTQKQLDYLRFPLGSINKSETRKIADKLKLNVAGKPDSQDICFVPNGNYASVIEKYRPQSFKKGDILDLNGKKLGSHDGIINYTIGQRKGIKIAKISGQVMEFGILAFLSTVAYISISLGLINLFPIPLLDGGHLMFYLFEKILGRPLKQATQEGFFRIGLFLLFSLMIFITFNDLRDLGLFQ